MVGVDALVRLANLATDEFEGPNLGRITTVLLPKDFTRVDGIIDLVFFAAEESAGIEDALDRESGESAQPHERKGPRAGFQSDVADRVAMKFGRTLVKQSRSMFAAVDGSFHVTCLVSRRYGTGQQEGYWFGYHPHQEKELRSATEGYVAFGCGSPALIFLVPVEVMAIWKQDMNTTERPGRMYWHVHIEREGTSSMVRLKPGVANPDLSPYEVRDSTRNS